MSIELLANETEVKYHHTPPPHESRVGAEKSEVAVCLDGNKPHKNILVWIYPLSQREATPQRDDIKRYAFDEWDVNKLRDKVRATIPFQPQSGTELKIEGHLFGYQFIPKRVEQICQAVINLQKRYE